MFTGIITDMSEVKSSRKNGENLTMVFKKPARWQDLKQGESVSVDGVCLTVAALSDNEYKCELMPETLGKTTFGKQLPKTVNLERSLKAGDRLGGHFVQGHVDEAGFVTKITKAGVHRVYIKFSPKNKNLVVPKGSIAINGVSLTISETKNNTLSVDLIPFTIKNTTLGKLKKGDLVNIEFDMLAKHIVRVMENAKS